MGVKEVVSESLNHLPQNSREFTLVFQRETWHNSRRMRTDALLSQFGYCSRREAALWVKRGRVSYRGVAVTSPTAKVEPAEVAVDGEPVPFPQGLYVAFNKPLGCTCSHREAGELVYDLLPAQWMRRNPQPATVGRLDKDTSGLLLITDDGSFIHALTSPRRHVSKLYAFTTAAPVPAEAEALFASGCFMLEGEKTPCLPAELRLTGACSGELVLHEGRYHQVRRMLAAVGAPVLTLHREAIGPLRLADLGIAPGEWAAIDPRIFFPQS